MLIQTLGANFSEILSEIHKLFIEENAFENVVWKMAAICLGLNVLTDGNWISKYRPVRKQIKGQSVLHQTGSWPESNSFL